MAASEERGSPAAVPQTAVEEAETKTFKDLVRMDDSGFPFFLLPPGAGRVRLPSIPAAGVQKTAGA